MTSEDRHLQVLLHEGLEHQPGVTPDELSTTMPSGFCFTTCWAGLDMSVAPS